MLKLQNLSKTFGTGTINERRAIDQLNLHLLPGDFVTVIGGNGAGKSTLLGLIAGVHLPDEGRVLLDGEDITPLPEHRRARLLGRVFQDPMTGTAGEMTIEENLAMAYRRGKGRGLGWGLEREERELYRQRLALLGLGLEDRLTTSVGLLSGGQRQALTLLMATLQRPKLLLLDEHTAALDPKTARTVLELTDQLVQQEQLTALMVTHNMHDALRLGNRLIMMREGRILYDVRGEEKARLQVSDLLERFGTGEGDLSDRMLLA